MLRPSFIAPVLVTAGFLALTLPAGAGETLTIRVNDVEALPGGIAAVSFRTYQSQSVGQGQMCLRAFESFNLVQGVGEPFSAFLLGKVFSLGNDAETTITPNLEGANQTVDLDFFSPSGGINVADGAFGVLYFRVADTVQPRDEFELQLDLADTHLEGPDGTPIPISVVPGRLRISGPGDDFGISADAEDVQPGAVAHLGMSTENLVRLSRGRVGIVFDPAIIDGEVKVWLDRRLGRAEYVVDDSTPGLVIVDFNSADGSLNRFPGQIVSVRVPTRADIPHGTRVPVFLDPGLTFLIDRDGVPLTLEMDSDVLFFP